MEFVLLYLVVGVEWFENIWNVDVGVGCFNFMLNGYMLIELGIYFILILKCNINLFYFYLRMVGYFYLRMVCYLF